MRLDDWAFWGSTLQLAVKNLLLHKLRSLLTMLGTVLGVASVISMVAIGEGSKQEAIERIRKLGASNVIIRTIKPNQADVLVGQGDSSSSRNQQRSILDYGLTYKDYELLLETIPKIKNSVTSTMVRKTVSNGPRRMPNARILGTTPDLATIKAVDMRYGRFLAPPDLSTTANVAVLGAGAARKLFSYKYPIDQSILVGDRAFQVIGVLASQSSGTATPGAIDQDDANNDIYVPLTAVQRRVGEIQQVGSREYERTELSEITLTMETEDLVMPTAAMARKLLNKRHLKEDYEIQTPLKLLRQAEQEKRMWNLVLGSIAGISLLVGGIGIMNIMLATVTERTREIGIRRALGATRQHITVQFLVESTTLSSIGGILGVILGMAIPLVVTLTADLQTRINWWFVLVAFGISVGIGMLFGVYPARRAASMSPIEALRHD